MGTSSYLSDLLHFEKHRQTLSSESYYILDRGQKEITVIHRSWLPHRACGINCLLKYEKQNQSISFGKK